MSEVWYSPADALPPLKVRVWVMWRGREFQASRVPHPTRAGHAWLTTSEWITTVDWIDGCPKRRTERRTSSMPVMLPDHGMSGVPRTGDDALGEDPDAWRPLNAKAWKLPLPAPIRAIEPGRMWSSRTRFTAVDDAEAADLAREMEADRETARVNGEGETFEIGGVRLPWWRDATQVTYSRPGSIGIREAEARLSRALLCDGIRCRPDGVLEVQTSSTLEDLVAGSAADLEDDANRWLMRFDALPQDREDELTALAWFAALNPPELHKGGVRPPNHFTREQRVLVWRAISRSWRSIGEDLACSDTTAKRIFGAALHQVCCAANGRPVFQHVKVKDQIAALRARNRQGSRARETA